MDKPWAVIALLPNLTNHECERFRFRSHAEAHADWLRRCLGKTITIRVIWSDANEQ